MSPDDPRAPGRSSAGGEHQLDGRRAQDHHEQDREHDGGDRSHPTSLAHGGPPLHSDAPVEVGRNEPIRATRIGGSIGDLRRQATWTIDEWLSRLEQAEAAVLAVEKDGDRRFIRLRGEEKSVFTIWMQIGQHTLHHETFMMPEPIENHAEFYAHLLRRNHSLRGVAFTIGAEDAIFLEGRTPLEGLDSDVLDAIVGTHYEAVERYFRAAMRIGWRSLFRG